MKNKKITITIGIIVFLIIILLGVIALSIIKPETPKKEKPEKDKFSTYLKNFQNANYKAELVYYTEVDKKESANHTLLSYYYYDDIEEYHHSDENSEIYQYNDYKNEKKYTKPSALYIISNLENKSNHELLTKLLKKVTVKKQDKDAFTLDTSKRNIKDFLEEFQKIDEKALKYSENVEYEIIVVTKNNNISNIIIKEKENNDKNIIYTFDKIGEISEIKIPVNEAIKEQ